MKTQKQKRGKAIIGIAIAAIMLTSVFAALTLTGSATTSTTTLPASVTAGTTEEFSIKIREDTDGDFAVGDVIKIKLPEGFTLTKAPTIEYPATTVTVGPVTGKANDTEITIPITAVTAAAPDVLQVTLSVDVSEDAYGTATFTLTDSTEPDIPDVTTMVISTKTRPERNLIRSGATIFISEQGLKFDVDDDGDFGEDGSLDTTTLTAVNTDIADTLSLSSTYTVEDVTRRLRISSALRTF
ncbi:MAG: hypothetical protein C4B55_01225 [Candidatus Methanophagaceae archaeon]|nr:MAG: hypothetical protein C4B55_01225 [Methanophagales archaeon]